MRLSRRHLAIGALVVAVLSGEVAGRWLVANLPLVDDVPRRRHGGLDAWPILVVVAKLGIGLLLARLSWRLVKAHRVARAGERLLRRRQLRASRPQPTIGLSPRAWLASFVAMSVLYLVPTSYGDISREPLITPWLHAQALPVFAVLAVVVAVLWRTISRWLAALERYGESLRQLIRSPRVRATAVRSDYVCSRAPRSLFGLAFQSRPPPAPA